MKIFFKPNLLINLLLIKNSYIAKKDFFIWNEINGTVALRYSERISQTWLILELDKAKYVQLLTRFSFDLSKLLGSLIQSWAKFIEQYQDTALSLSLSLAHRYATYTSKSILGSSEFSRRTDHLFSGATLLSNQKVRRPLNSTSDRSKEISSIKGSCETFYPIRACQTCGKSLLDHANRIIDISSYY